eukprot:scaffold648900_cov37-Prasinocladus_malaysianus.AAC.1
MSGCRTCHGLIYRRAFWLHQRRHGPRAGLGGVFDPARLAAPAVSDVLCEAVCVGVVGPGVVYAHVGRVGAALPGTLGREVILRT